MNQPVIRRRSDVENASPTSDLPQQSLVESSPEDKDIEQDFDNNQIRPQTSISSTTFIILTLLNPITATILTIGAIMAIPIVTSISISLVNTNNLESRFLKKFCF